MVSQPGAAFIRIRGFSCPRLICASLSGSITASIKYYSFVVWGRPRTSFREEPFSLHVFGRESRLVEMGRRHASLLHQRSHAPSSNRAKPLGSHRCVANGAVTKHQVRYNCDDRQLKKYQNPNDEIDDINRWCPPSPFVARTKRSRCCAANTLYESRFRTVASCRRHRSNPLNGDGDFH